MIIDALRSQGPPRRRRGLEVALVAVPVPRSYHNDDADDTGVLYSAADPPSSPPSTPQDPPGLGTAAGRAGPPDFGAREGWGATMALLPLPRTSVMFLIVPASVPYH